MGTGKPPGGALAGLDMVHMHSAPYHPVLIGHLIGVGDPFDRKGALPPWCQLVGTLGRSRHHEDEVTFVIWAVGLRSWRGSHLLVSEGEALADHVNIGHGVWC